MPRLVVSVLALLIFTGSSQARVNKAQKEAARQAFDLYASKVTLPEQVSPLAWDRASEWMSIAPDRRIEVDTKNALQTYKPYDSGSMDLSCSVKRRRIVEGVSVSANCYINNMFASGQARRGSIMLRRYILTGEESCLHSGDRWADVVRCLLDCNEDGSVCEAHEPVPVFPEIVSEEPMVVGGCTLDQITSMAAAGLEKDQIKAACGEG